ncbi:MAG: inorganic pyrophosphatase [Gammaproteobacteria bacterium]
MDDFIQWRPHPWHGLELGHESPDVVNAFIEITPFDLVKYEVDKPTGYLRIDRPNKTSSLPPTLYGFIPRTYCADRVRDLMPGAARGDGDPLDICVISERPIARAEVILRARVVGGLPMLDDGEADDKIIAVLDNDEIWSDVRDITGLPRQLVARLRHYYSTYKTLPVEEGTVEVGAPYSREHAARVIEAAALDYADSFPG